MGKYEETICELYDNNPSAYQIRSIAGMYNIDVEEVKRILTDNGRELPKPPRQAKASIKKDYPPEYHLETQKETPEKESEKENLKNIPDAVKALVFNRIDDLDKELTDLKRRIDSLEEAKAKVVSEYKVLADFISVPFGAGNLSQESSVDKGESPQANA